MAAALPGAPCLPSGPAAAAAGPQHERLGDRPLRGAKCGARGQSVPAFGAPARHWAAPGKLPRPSSPGAALVRRGFWGVVLAGRWAWPLERRTGWGGWSFAARFAFQGWPARIVESGGALPCWHKLGLWALGSGTRGAGGLLAGQLGARDRLTRHVAVACSRSCACACVRARLWVIGSECLERLAEWAEDLAHATCNMHSARGRGL